MGRGGVSFFVFFGKATALGRCWLGVGYVQTSRTLSLRKNSSLLFESRQGGREASEGWDLRDGKRISRVGFRFLAEEIYPPFFLWQGSSCLGRFFWFQFISLHSPFFLGGGI